MPDVDNIVQEMDTDTLKELISSPDWDGNQKSRAWELLTQMQAMFAELKRLREVVEKLPKDALGNPVAPGQMLYTEYGAERIVFSADRAGDPNAIEYDPSSPICELYPTRESAAASLREKGESK